VYGSAYSTCTAAINMCNNYGMPFTEPTCGGATTGEYCFDYDYAHDCTPIRNSSYCHIKSVAACLSEGGSLQTESWCASNASGGFYLKTCGL
jgi:hypothetical protein